MPLLETLPICVIWLIFVLLFCVVGHFLALSPPAEHLSLAIVLAPWICYIISHFSHDGKHTNFMEHARVSMTPYTWQSCDRRLINSSGKFFIYISVCVFSFVDCRCWSMQTEIVFWKLSLLWTVAVFSRLISVPYPKKKEKAFGQFGASELCKGSGILNFGIIVMAVAAFQIRELFSSSNFKKNIWENDSRDSFIDQAKCGYVPNL